ncbi:MAG: sensor histidine kinase N-terminal domain-containing protein [Lysobacter sp.]
MIEAEHERPSIRRTLLLSIGLLSLVGMMLLFFGASQYGRRAADLSYDRLLNASALTIADSISLVDGQWEANIPCAALELLSTAPDDRAFYRVFLSGGRTLTGYDDLPRPPLSARDQTTFFDADYRGEPVRFAVLRRAASSADGPEAALVQIGQTRRAREEVAEDIVWHVTGWIALFTVAILLLAWFAIDRALQPLVRIEQDFSVRTPFDLRPITRAVPTELSHVVAAQNHFMSRLSTNIDVLRTYIAEAAHQMRNPLASLRAQAQLSLHQNNPEQWRQGLHAIERHSGKLSRLLNQLLSHANVTHRAELHHFKALNLETIARQALHESVPLAEPRPDVRFECSVRDPVLHGDALMLREAIKNLIDNAIKHGTGDHAPVHVRLEQDPDGFVLSVSDAGPGMSEEDCERAFERFGRGESASAQGAGLGLAIVKRVVESHGGRVELAGSEFGGLCVRLHLPRDAA